MDPTIVASVINSITVLIAAVIGYYAVKAGRAAAKAEKTATKAEGDIKEISGNLPSWRELFEHNESGEPIKGNIDHLIEAVNKGYPIKIRINKAQKGDIEVMDAQWIFVENNMVIATNAEQISLGQDKSGKYHHFKDAYHYYVIVTSKGQHHATRIHIDGRPRGEPSDGVRHMTWIGLVPPSL